MRQKRLYTYLAFGLSIVAIVVGLVNIVNRYNANSTKTQTTDTGQVVPIPEYYVSLSGNDSNPGTLASPFATLTHARDVAAAQTIKGATIYIRGGTYPLNSAITLTSANSGTSAAPLTIQNYPGEYPVFMGSKQLTLTPGATGEVDFNLASYGVTASLVKSVYYNGVRQNVARTPNYATPNFSAADPWAGQFYYATTDTPAGSTTQIKYDPAQFDPTSWATTTGSRIVIYAGVNYWADDLAVQSIDTVNHIITTTSSTTSTLSAHNRFFLYNQPEQLDAGGEYYLNTTSGQLRYILAAPVQAGDRLTVVLNYRAMDTTGVQYLTLKGLDFQEFGRDAINVVSGSNILFDNIKIRNAPVKGILMTGFSHDITLQNSQLSGLAGDGVLVSPDTSYFKNLQSTNISFLNNHIYNLDLLAIGQQMPLEINQAPGVHIANNELHDVPRMSMFINASPNAIIEDNKVYNTMRSSEDGGAIYLESIAYGANSRSWLARGDIVRRNTVNNTGGYGWSNAAGAYRFGYYSFGIYLDDYTSSATVTQNIVSNVGTSCFMNHLGQDNTYTNNICYNTTPSTTSMFSFSENDDYVSVDYKWQYVQDMAANGYNVAAWFAAWPQLGQLYRIPVKGTTMVRNTVTNNIFYSTGGAAQIMYNLYNYNPAGNTVNSNVFYLGGLQPQAGGSFSDGTGKSAWSWAEWQAHGEDLTSVIADPLLVDPTNGNFALQSNSPALTKGFNQVTQAAIGIRSVTPTVSDLYAPPVQQGTAWKVTYANQTSNLSPVTASQYKITNNTANGTIVTDWTTLPTSPASIDTSGLSSTQTYVLCVRSQNDEFDPATGSVALWSPSSCTSPGTLTTANICAQLAYSGRTANQGALTGIKFELLANGSSTVLGTVTDRRTEANDTVNLSSSAFNAFPQSSTYDVRITAPGFLRRKLTAVRLDSGCLSVPSNNPLTVGDFDGSDVIGLNDIVAIIRAYNNNQTAEYQTVSAALGRAPTVGDIVTVIGNYNQHPVGD